MCLHKKYTWICNSKGNGVKCIRIKILYMIHTFISIISCLLIKSIGRFTVCNISSQIAPYDVLTKGTETETETTDDKLSNASYIEELFGMKEVYADIGNTVTLPCIISNTTSTQSWMKGQIVMTQGFEINKSFGGQERLEVLIDERFYNLKIYNITEHDFDTYWCETQQGNSTTTEATKLSRSGLNFSVKIVQRNKRGIKLQVMVISSTGEEFTKLKYTFKTADHTTRTGEFSVSGQKKFFKVKRLTIGFCFKFQIYVYTTSGEWIGPINKTACTKPERPDSPTGVMKTTATSIYMLIQHPREGHFDSFRIEYRNNLKQLSMTVNKSSDVKETMITILGLLPESCYIIDIYTVSFSESSDPPRSFSNVCTPEQFTSTFNLSVETTVTTEWPLESFKSTLKASSNTEPNTNTEWQRESTKSPSSAMSTYKTNTDTEWKRESIKSILSATSTFETSTDTEWQGKSFKSTSKPTLTAEGNTDRAVTVGQSIYTSLFATGFVVVCLIVGCKYVFNKFKGVIEKRKERSSDYNTHQDVLHGNGTNNDSTNDTALEENEYTYSHYETINENEMIEMSYPTTSEKWPDLSYLKQETDDKSNTEFAVEIETNSFEDCKTSHDSISVSTYSSEQSGNENIPNEDKKAGTHQNEYFSLIVDNMEYESIYSRLDPENIPRKNNSQNSCSSGSPCCAAYVSDPQPEGQKSFY